jgi:hypothetical protein
MSAPPARKDATTRGQVDGVAAGNAGIQAAYSGYNYYWNGYSCLNSPVNGDGYATVNVVDSGCPDHLAVQGDTDSPIHCPSGLSCAQRLVTYGVVDANNVGVSGVVVLEDIFSTTSSTCTPPLLPKEAPPSYRANGTFTDGLTTNCPGNVSDCGFKLSASWLSVTPSSPPYFAATILATLNNEVVHNTYTTVLGYTLDKGATCNHIPLGTYVYANGTFAVSKNPTCP